MKYSVRGLVLLTHWMLEFMKQVFPRLLRPVAPFSVGTAADKGRGNSNGTTHSRPDVVCKKNEVCNPYNQSTFVSVHLAAVGDEGHLLRPAHVLVSN